MNKTLPTFVLAFCAATSATATTLFSNEALFEAAASTLSVIDFSSDAAGQPLLNGVVIDNEYVSLGVTFAVDANYPLTNFLSSDLPTNGQGDYSGGNFIDLGPAGRPAAGPLEISFHNAVRSFALWLGDIEDVAGTSKLTASFADGSTEMIDLNPVTGDGPFQFSFFGAIFDKDVEEIEVAISPLDYVIIDDVAFGSAAPTPQPTPAPCPLPFRSWRLPCSASAHCSAPQLWDMERADQWCGSVLSNA